VIDGSGEEDVCRLIDLTPNLTFLSKDPIVPPLCPDPFCAPPFPDFVVIGFDCGENGGGYLIVVVGVAHHQ
jgi:hypothetical protein